MPAVQEMRVQSLGRDDPLEKGLATHSSFLAWEIPWTEEPGGLILYVSFHVTLSIHLSLSPDPHVHLANSFLLYN